MELNNGILDLKLTNKGGEMASLTYKGKDILYKGDGEYWSGKNPTLFPMISSPNTKQYTLDGITYPCRNHGLIRYATLQTIKDSNEEVIMRLSANDETLKEYPFNFEYNITYKLDGNKVLIKYDITNKDNKVMPFTFGLHPGFIVNDFDNIYLSFKDDDVVTLFNQKDRTTSPYNLHDYSGKQFLDDLAKYDTVIFEDVKSKVVSLNTEDYVVDVDMSKFKYLALWTADPNAKYMCIEPWLSINNIKAATNPFDDCFELEHLDLDETFSIDYYIEIKEK